MNYDPGSGFTNAWDLIKLMSDEDEVILTSEDSEAEVDYWLEQEYMYDCYIQEFAKTGLYMVSLADQMQSLGTNHSMIGTRLSFQIVPKEWNLQTEMSLFKSQTRSNLPPN